MELAEGVRGSRLYLDANVFIYAFEGDGDRAACAIHLLQAVERGTVTAVTSELTLAEVLVLPLKFERADLALLYQDIFETSAQLRTVPVTRDILVKSAVFRATLGGKLPDAIHVASGTDSGCDFFVTEDKSIRLPGTLPKVALTDLKEVQ